ncbi:MAG TPA: Gfo/Idh/MocA family oxidoreductase [Dehalococcoidia bacterium]|nr:Gfo/Idh/MocA family oxidoreductase [Dehalococcoidia bacterium]
MSDDLAIGVVGLGHGANHARILSQLPGVRLAAVCDLDESRLASAAKGRSLRTYTHYEAMLAEEALDAVVVAVPARLHEAVAIAAIEAGCALLVEKPLAPSLEEGKRLAQAASNAGVALMPGHIERFNPAVRELTKRVRAGEVGAVLDLTARRMGPIVIRTLGPDVNVVYDTAIHDIDVMRYILGAEVERAYCEARSDLGLPFEDSIIGLLRFSPKIEERWTSLPASESLGSAQFEARRLGEGATATLDANWLAPRRIRDLTVRGTEGVFVLDYMAQTLELYPGKASLEQPGGSANSQPQAISIPIEQDEPLLQELTAFVAALRQGRPMPVTADDALAALSVCDALTESARTGLPVIPARVR